MAMTDISNWQSVAYLQRTFKVDYVTGCRIKDFIESLLVEAKLEGARKFWEAVKPTYLAPHASMDDKKYDAPRCGDCFCEIQQLHTHNNLVKELTAKAEQHLTPTGNLDQ
jgi:hypothetical protein